MTRADTAARPAPPGLLPHPDAAGRGASAAGTGLADAGVRERAA